MTNILAYQNQNIDNINTIGYIFCYSIGNIEIEREIFNTLYDKFYNTYLRLSREDSASYSKKQIQTFIKRQLKYMDAIKLTVKGQYYFIPYIYESDLSLLLKFINSVKSRLKCLGDSSTIYTNTYDIINNSHKTNLLNDFIVYYNSVIALYHTKINVMIEKGGTDKKVALKWVKRIEELKQTVSVYKDIFSQKIIPIETELQNLEYFAAKLKSMSYIG